ncbi:MAG: TAXI family TRAP transporter solute-binding subunit [bacterium]
MKSRIGWLVGIIAAVFLVSGGFSPETASAAKSITMKGGQIRGAYNRWTSAYAVFLTKELDGIQVSSESSTGAAENVRAVNSGAVELALTFSSESYLGWRGQAHYKKPQKNLRTMTYLFGSVGHLLVPASSSVKTVYDLKGKTLSMGGPGSGSAKNLTNLLKHLKIWGSFKAVYLGRKSPEAMRNGKIIGYNWHPGLGNAMIRDTATMMKIRFINMDAPARKSGFYKKFPYYGPTVIPAGVYPNVNVDTPTFGTGSVMIANSNVSADLIYKILKAIYSEKGKKYILSAAGKVAKELSIKNGLKLINAPLHPGAVRFWKENGKKIPADLLP